MMKKVVKTIACIVIALAVIIPTIYSRTKAEAHTCESMHIMEESLITPNSTEKGKNEWNREFADTEEGLRVKYGTEVINSAYMHRTRNTVSADGLHTKFTFHTGSDGTCDSTRTFGIWFSTANDNGGNGLSFKVQLSTGQLYCYVDGASIDHSGYAGYNGVNTDRIFIPDFDTTSTTAEIRTAITTTGDFVFTINGHDFVVPKSVWQASNLMGDGKHVYFKIAPTGKSLDFTWNYFHGGAETCYDRQQNAESLKLNIEKMKKADIYPNGSAGDTNWDGYRTLTDTESGVKVEYVSGINAPNFSHASRNALSADGAHMKLTLSSGYKINICISTVSGNSTGPGINFQIAAEGYLYPSIDGANLIGTYGSEYSNYSTLNNDRVVIPSNVQSSMATNLEIKTDIRENGDFVFTINGFDFVVKKAHWYESTNLNHGNDVYFKVGPGGRQVTYTWQYLHGGNETCPDELTEIIGAEMTERLVTAVTRISEIQVPITANSKTQIDAAKLAIQAVPKKYISYISNMGHYEGAAQMYEALGVDAVNLDAAVYPVMVNDVGPVSASWADSVKYYEAESGVGVTVEYIDTTVHQVGINNNKTASLDNCHIQFANFESNWKEHQFALVLSETVKASVQSNDACMRFRFWISDNRIRVAVHAANMPEYEFLNTTLLGASTLKDLWSINIDKLDDGKYEFKLCNAISAIIPDEYITAATDAGLDLEACHFTYSAYNFGGVKHTAKIDIVSLHSGEDECYCNVAKADYEATEQCKALIDAIGTVTIDSEDAINAADEAYNALPDKFKKLVLNLNVLTRAKKDFNDITADAKLAQVVIKAINKLPAKASDATYEQLIDCYSKYLDLYPRTRKYVTNADKLLKYVAAYEKAHPGVELKQETVNEYTGGKNAHYNKK